ncbi:MAG: 4-hydroxy-tetrahydrodipicolinate reductase [Chitinophagales bacterium]|nr:4-hydroxy-tetrahydrodipicolinate reductase [Bacteroidota bacterium]
MKVLLIGYGKMGETIDTILSQNNEFKSVEVVGRIRTANAADLQTYLSRADVAIEFSTPQTVVPNLFACFEAQIPVVCGTTGWYGRFEEVKNYCLQQNASLFYATNFSIGMNIFRHINQVLAQIMNKFPDYKASMTEIHHSQKLDRPSGTAITLAEDMIDRLDALERWEDTPETDTEHTLSIQVIRQGDEKGTHSIQYESKADMLQWTHAAKNREGFAYGAVLAAKWLQNKKGIYTMKDMLQF